MDLGQIDAQDPVQGLARREGERIVRLRLVTGRGQRRRWRRTRSLQPIQHRRDARVARGHLGLVGVIQLEGLRKREDVLLAVVADQCLVDRLGLM